MSAHIANVLVVRGVLGLCNAFSLVAFGRSVQKAFGTTACIWYALFQASQFHAIYYASRTLPNMFAFVFSKSCIKIWLPKTDGEQATLPFEPY
jgi:alpha-1,6-mannosyltransferase